MYSGAGYEDETGDKTRNKRKEIIGYYKATRSVGDTLLTQALRAIATRSRTDFEAPHVVQERVHAVSVHDDHAILVLECRVIPATATRTGQSETLIRKTRQTR